MSASAQPATSHVRRPYRALRFTRDEELVRLLRAGDERAFEAMYDRHHRGILAFCRHMLGSAEEAEDVVQHTFIAAHRDLVTSDKPMQLKAWLYTVARNRCLSVLRVRKEERALDDVSEPSVRGLAAEVQQREDLREVLSDLQRLPEDQRAALVLSELGALSHEEIGAALGVRRDKVKALVFQARESLASSRSARDADCREIQEQLAVLRGGSLRRTTLRRHVEVCPACAAFKAEVKRQRSAMAAILPVVPSLALKESVLAAVFGSGAAGGGGIFGGGLLAAGGAKALVAQVTTIAVVAGGATGGGLVVVDEISNGRGDTATAMAGVPAEDRSIELVGALRERARRTAEERAADRGVASRFASIPADFPTAEPDVAAAAPQTRRRTRAERGAGSPQTAGTRRGGEPAAASAPQPAAAPAPVSGVFPAPRRRGSGSGNGRKSRQTGPGIDPRPSRGSDGERGHRRPARTRLRGVIPGAVRPAASGEAVAQDERPGRKIARAVARRSRRPRKRALPPVAPEQARPGTSHPAVGRDDRERGRGDGDEARGDAKKAYAAARAIADVLEVHAKQSRP